MHQKQFGTLSNRVNGCDSRKHHTLKKIKFFLPRKNTYNGSISNLIDYLDFSRNKLMMHPVRQSYDIRSLVSLNMKLCHTITKFELLLAKQEKQCWGQLTAHILYLNLTLSF